MNDNKPDLLSRMHITEGSMIRAGVDVNTFINYSSTFGNNPYYVTWLAMSNFEGLFEYTDDELQKIVDIDLCNNCTVIFILFELYIPQSFYRCIIERCGEHKFMEKNPLSKGYDRMKKSMYSDEKFENLKKLIRKFIYMGADLLRSPDLCLPNLLRMYTFLFGNYALEHKDESEKVPQSNNFIFHIQYIYDAEYDEFFDIIFREFYEADRLNLEEDNYEFDENLFYVRPSERYLIKKMVLKQMISKKKAEINNEYYIAELDEKVTELDEKVAEQEKIIKELKLQISSMPGGDLYLQSKEQFEENQ